ncbi:MAG: DUF948 domain-containing protein [Candidatus Eiseniibacteriota bacterium]
MPIVVQVSIAVAALALVAGVIALIRVLGQLRSTAQQLERTMVELERSIPQVTKAVDHASEVLTSINGVTDQVKGIVDRFEPVGRKAAQLTSVFVDEVVEPASRVAAIVRGVKVGASTFMGNMFQRRGKEPARLSGGNHDE